MDQIMGFAAHRNGPHHQGTDTSAANDNYSSQGDTFPNRSIPVLPPIQQRVKLFHKHIAAKDYAPYQQKEIKLQRNPLLPGTCAFLLLRFVA